MLVAKGRKTMSSQFPGFDAGNPYATPQGGAFRPPPSESRRFPVFAKVMFIFDLVVSGLRAPVVLFSVIGYQQLVNAQSPLVPAAVAEIASGAILVLLGVAANVLLLLRKPWAVLLGYLLLLAALGSLAIGFWQLFYRWDELPPGSPERIGFVIGAGFTVCLRLGVMGVYFAALWQFAAWSKSQAEGAGLSRDGWN
jgi:hypothetical protein